MPLGLLLFVLGETVLEAILVLFLERGDLDRVSIRATTLVTRNSFLYPKPSCPFVRLATLRIWSRDCSARVHHSHIFLSCSDSNYASRKIDSFFWISEISFCSLPFSLLS